MTKENDNATYHKVVAKVAVDKRSQKQKGKIQINIVF